MHDQRQLKKDVNWEEQKLPGLNFTSNQMFWISWSQLWCSKYRDDFLKKVITSGVHAPGEYRINGPLSNNEEFAKDFNCPKTSTMNPEKKCTIW